MGIGQTLATESRGIVNFAFVLGLGLIMLGKFTSVSGITSGANTTVTSIISSLGDFADWIGIIVLVVVGVLLMSKWNKSKGGF